MTWLHKWVAKEFRVVYKLNLQQYKYITKVHFPSQMKQDGVRRLNIECDDYLDIADILLWIKHKRIRTYSLYYSS